MKKLIPALALTTMLGISAEAKADYFMWQTNEVHLQHGTLDRAYTNNLDETVFITTIQHADEWKYGDNFFFLDIIDGEDTGHDKYFEIYPNFSLGKIFGTKVGFGPLKDVGVLAGFNWAEDSKVYKYLPGIRLSWDVPGTLFFNTDITAYIDDSDGAAAGGAPAEDDSFMIDVNWAWPIEVSDKHKFSIEGHLEFIGDRDNEFGNEVKEHILAQPQFRYDVGNFLFNKPQHIYAGIEYQYWMNKLGDDNTDESAVQALLVGRF